VLDPTQQHVYGTQEISYSPVEQHYVDGPGESLFSGAGAGGT